MRVGIYGAGISIERVLTPPTVPQRRFRGLLDTVFTVALGSVCAFALTLGPAPLNTVAVTSAAAETFAELDAAPASGPPATEGVERHQPAADEASRDDQSPRNSEEAARPGTDAVDNSTGGTALFPVSPREGASVVPIPAAPVAPPVLGSVAETTQSAAVAIVEAYRTASGLPGFVAADACINPAVHSVVQVTPPTMLSLGFGQKSLAAHPAFAAVEDNGLGAIAVTIYTCQ